MNRRNLLGMAIGGVSLALAVDKVLAAEEHESTICDEKISSRMSGVEVVPGVSLAPLHFSSTLSPEASQRSLSQKCRDDGLMGHVAISNS